MTDAAVALLHRRPAVPAAVLRRPAAVIRAAGTALLVHGILAWMLLASPSRGSGSADSGRVVHVRAVSVVERPNVGAAPPVELAVPATPAVPPAGSRSTPLLSDVESGPMRTSTDEGRRSPARQKNVAMAGSEGLSPDSKPDSPTVTPAQALATSLPAAPEYLAGGQLDPGPRPIGDVDPPYPPEGKLQEGTVVLRLLINAEGGVDAAAVVRSYPKDLFDAAALVAWRAARFEPGRVLGLPVKSQITIEVRFSPINRGQISTRSY